MVVDVLSHKTQSTLSSLIYDNWEAFKVFSKFGLEIAEGEDHILLYALEDRPR